MMFQGIRVLEVSAWVMVPAAGVLLRDFGAEVIKVEHPKGGDVSRKWGPPLPDGGSAAYHAVNMGKQSVVADMTDADDLARLRAQHSGGFVARW